MKMKDRRNRKESGEERKDILDSSLQRWLKEKRKKKERITDVGLFLSTYVLLSRLTGTMEYP